MEYSASMVSTLFWWSETQQVAQMLKDNVSAEEMKKKAIDENIFMVKAPDRRRRILNLALKRLKSLPDEMVSMLASAEFRTAKLIVLISVMCTDRLFHEYCYDVYRKAIVLGRMQITDDETNRFFNEKIGQSEKVASFSTSAIYKLKQTYTKVLYEAGLLSDSAKERKILIPFINNDLDKICQENDLTAYLNILLGRKI